MLPSYKYDRVKKKDASVAAIEYVENDCILGVGTGSTVNHFIKCLGHSGKRPRIIVATSKQSERLLQLEGFDCSVLSNMKRPVLDIYIDGADEVDPRLNLIKGGGGALTSEKIILNCAEKFVCIVDESKLVTRLGKFGLPIEVIAAAIPSIRAFIDVNYGGVARERPGFITEHGNPIIDVSGLDIDQPEFMERELNQIPGVVTVGIFSNQKPAVCIVGCDSGVKELFSEEIV